MRKRILVGSVLGTAMIAVVLAATVGGASARKSAATPLPASSCSAIQGTGDKLIASDLPLQGAGRTQTVEMTKAIAFILGQDGWKAGNYTLAYQSCDDSTAQAGKWDSGKCSTNANAYALGCERRRRDRDVQLGLCRDRDPDPQPCSERPARDDQPGEHVRRPDPHRSGDLRGRAEQVLPDRQAQLRARRRG